MFPGRWARLRWEQENGNCCWLLPGFPGCIGAVSSLLETLVFRVLLCPAIGKVAAPSLYHLLLSERGEFFPYHTNATCSNLYLNLRQLLSKPLSEPHIGNAEKKYQPLCKAQKPYTWWNIATTFLEGYVWFPNWAVLEMPASPSICPVPPFSCQEQWSVTP